jgi:hypothetical protein
VSIYSESCTFLLVVYKLVHITTVIDFPHEKKTSLDMLTTHGPHSSNLVVICVVLLLFELFYVSFVCKCVLYYCHWVTTQLQLTNTVYHISYHIISYRIVYHTISYDIIPYHTISYHIIPYIIFLTFLYMVSPVSPVMGEAANSEQTQGNGRCM